MNCTSRIKNHYTLFIVVLFIYLSGCNSSKSQYNSEMSNIGFNIDLVIGLEDQGDEYQLGDPIGVRTDTTKNIYIADRAALEIKVFDSSGQFKKSIGKRGRGPGEFHDINMFELTPDGNFIIVDRGNLRYTSITRTGDEIFSGGITISDEWQFYPDDVDYINDNELIALFTDGSHPEYSSPILERPLFYRYSHDFKERRGAFFPFNELDEDLQTSFAWLSFLGRPGSFVTTPDKKSIFYSPRIYSGKIYHIVHSDTGWVTQDVISGVLPKEKPYNVLDESEFNALRNRNIPGISRTYYDKPEPYMGRVNSVDAGIYLLNDGSLIHYWHQWRNILDDNGEHEPILDLYVQIFDETFKVKKSGRIFSIETTQLGWVPMVNWKDENDNFYLIQNTDKSYPLVKRFILK